MAVLLPWMSLNCLSRQHWLMLTRIVLIVMIVMSEKDIFLQQYFIRTKFCRWSVKSKVSSNYVGFLLWQVRKQTSKKTKFYEKNLFSFCYYFDVTLKRLSGVLLTTPCSFSQTVFSREGEALIFCDF